MRAIAALALSAAACGVDMPPPEPLPSVDVARFAATVQPIVDERCADPSCHGREDRPLSLYGTRRYRRDPARTFLDEPLDDTELHANALRVAVIDLDVHRGGAPVGSCIVLRKPLPVAAGGCAHGGGVIFRSHDEAEYRAVESWLATVAWAEVHE